MAGEESDTVTCIVVPVDRVEEVRKKLSEDNMLDRGHRIEVHGETAYIPVSQKPEGDILFKKHVCRRLKRRPASYKENIELPASVVEILPSAYDVIGDIVVVRLPNEAMEHRDIVGRALLDFVPGCRAVFMDEGTMGEWRIRSLVLIAGEGSTKTIHRENGLDMMVDLSRAYFSPRLACEHWRIAEIVDPGEFVLDMFTGTGGFPLTIAKHREPRGIMAVDINPGAIELLEESITLNKLTRIEALVSDALAIEPSVNADRTIMNLPHGARRFLDHAVMCTRSGGIIHYHEILDNRMVGDVKKFLEREHSVEIITNRDVRTYAPGQTHMVFDMKKI